MYRDPQKLTKEKFDLLIIGGGIHGLATAWDATLRGLKVAVIDKGDWGSETSAASLKIIHGGLRYLQQSDIQRMRESIRERSTMLRIAPHLINPYPFLIPTYGHGLKSKEALATALKINDMIGVDRNMKLVDPDQHIPNGWSISKNECHEYAPFLSEKGLTGGVIFFDARMHNSERVTLAFAQAAAEKGAQLGNYVACESLIANGQRVIAANVRDMLTNEKFDIRAKMYVCLCGPWTDLIPKWLGEKPELKSVSKSAGLQLISPVVSKPNMGLGIMSGHKDADARFRRGGRHYFTTPWRGKTIWGTTDKIYEGDPDQWKITEQDIEEYIQELNAMLPELHLKRGDVSHVYGGLRPLVSSSKKNPKLAQKPIIKDHEKDFYLSNLISAEGVKFTTCRLLAEKITTQIFQKLKYKPPKCMTAHTPIWGGNFPAYQYLRAQAKLYKPHDLSDDSFDYIIRNYGSDYKRIFNIVSRQPESACLLPDSKEIPEAVVLFSLYAEQAVRLSDVVLRRTDAGTLGIPSKAMIERIIEIMHWELSWSPSRQQEEIELLKKNYTYPSA